MAQAGEPGYPGLCSASRRRDPRGPSPTLPGPEGSPDAATVLLEIPSASAAAASELLALATAHLARVAAALDAGAPLDGLLPGSDAPPPDHAPPCWLGTQSWGRRGWASLEEDDTVFCSL